MERQCRFLFVNRSCLQGRAYIIYICSIVFLLVYPDLSRPKHTDRFDPVEIAKYSQYQCSLLSTCTDGGEPICGFDERTSVLAEFRDMCNFHKTNCETVGMYLEVDMEICEARKVFENETFEFEHVQTAVLKLPGTKDTTSIETTSTSETPSVKILNNSSHDDPTRLMGLVQLAIRH